MIVNKCEISDIFPSSNPGATGTFPDSGCTGSSGCTGITEGNLPLLDTIGIYAVSLGDKTKTDVKISNTKIFNMFYDPSPFSKIGILGQLTDGGEGKYNIENCDIKMGNIGRPADPVGCFNNGENLGINFLSFNEKDQINKLTTNISSSSIQAAANDDDDLACPSFNSAVKYDCVRTITESTIKNNYILTAYGCSFSNASETNAGVTGEQKDQIKFLFESNTFDKNRFAILHGVWNDVDSYESTIRNNIISGVIVIESERKHNKEMKIDIYKNCIGSVSILARKSSALVNINENNITFDQLNQLYMSFRTGDKIKVNAQNNYWKSNPPKPPVVGQNILVEGNVDVTIPPVLVKPFACKPKLCVPEDMIDMIPK